ncbi:uncharacterized protein LOC108664337 [Hyalella azteca]|uniref:Uncharacterized protein LOC108664337 n=1 Tax=Hyalella azteca TaxID=294128 RepID=A0A8B7MXX4_HYAAZ|nr:uncharacterized protein LOC108664337 [Hyalella azteca]
MNMPALTPTPVPLEGCCSGLRITKINVPARVAVGDSAVLECEWVSPNNKDVYSLKWYFGLEEFYRWTPAEKNPVQVFRVNAFDVSEAESSKGTVVIRNLSRKASGVMRCEISEEAPSFHTDAKTARLEVVDLPDSPPLLSPLQAVYELHQQVQLNCSSVNAYPPPTLVFFINSEPVNPTWVGRNESFRSRVLDGLPLYTSTRQLQFRLLPRLLNNDGRLLVKCTAEIAGIYWETNEVELPIDQPQRASIMEGRSSAGYQCCSHCVATSLPLLLLLRMFRLLH